MTRTIDWPCRLQLHSAIEPHVLVVAQVYSAIDSTGEELDVGSMGNLPLTRWPKQCSSSSSSLHMYLLFDED